MSTDTTVPSAPRAGSTFTATDVLAFVVVALVTWAGCAAGLACWAFLPIVGVRDIEHLGEALERAGRLAEVGVFAALVPAVALAVLAVCWRRGVGRSRAGTAILAVTLVVAAPAVVTIQGKLLAHEEPRAGLLFSGADDYEFRSDYPSPVGTVVAFVDPDADVPSGWLLADGRSLARETHRELYDVIGTAYGGAGDAFCLPDYRGMVVMDLRSLGSQVTTLGLRPLPEAFRELTAERGALRVVDVRWLIRAGK